MRNALRGKRTFLLAAVTMLSGYLLQNDIGLAPERMGQIITVLGFVAALLRIDTSTPPGKKD